ncbi:hypothetical protein FACS1894211_00900 [Clostridia bacterium]|nr:hypothetical protein FACS1894211_00900 [Clostridia bacterium]
MKQDKIFAVVKKAGGDAEIRLIEKEPKALSGLVGGKREIIPFPGMPGVCAVFDGEAAGSNKKPNCFLPEYGDLIAGTAVFAGISFETGFVSLTEEQAGRIGEYANANDAKGFEGNVSERAATGYLPHTEENYLFGLLSEVKTKYKTLKFKWLNKR